MKAEVKSQKSKVRTDRAYGEQKAYIVEFLAVLNGCSISALGLLERLRSLNKTTEYEKIVTQWEK